MTTARELIKGSLRLIGVVAAGEDPSLDEYNDGLTAMNQMLDSWSIERLSVFSLQEQVFTWPASTISRTLGPSGDFVGNRPVQIDDSTYFVDTSTGVSYGLSLVNSDQYNAIALKTATSTYPQALWVNMTHPDIEMYVYPVPTRDLAFHFVSVNELTQAASLDTVLAFPPGYLRAFRYNLACEYAAEFGVEPSPSVKRIAAVAKRAIKRINAPGDLMGMPSTLVSNRPRYNIYAGNF